MYPESDAPSVPWEFLGEFLAKTKSRLEDALAGIPDAKILYVDVVLSRRTEDEEPLKEYKLSAGEKGMGICPDDKIEEDADESTIDAANSTLAKPAEVLPAKTIFQKISRFFSGKQNLGVTKTAMAYSSISSPAQEIVQNLLFEIRNELAVAPEVANFAVGTRSLFLATTVSCAGYNCERKLVSLLPLRFRWYLREYYTKADGSCGKRWTDTSCVH